MAGQRPPLFPLAENVPPREESGTPLTPPLAYGIQIPRLSSLLQPNTRGPIQEVDDGDKFERTQYLVTKRQKQGLQIIMEHFSYPNVSHVIGALGSGGLLRRAEVDWKAGAAAFLTVADRQLRESMGQRQLLRAALQHAEAKEREARERLQESIRAAQAAQRTNEKILEVERQRIALLEDKLQRLGRSAVGASQEGGPLGAASEGAPQAKRTRNFGAFRDSFEGQPLNFRGARKGAVEPRQQTRRNSAIRQILSNALKSIQRVVGSFALTGDTQAHLKAIARALQVASGGRSLVADPSFLVPERTRLKQDKETRKTLLGSMYDPEAWIQLYDDYNITFKSGRGIGGILPRGAKPNDNKLLATKKYLDDLMVEILPIKPTAGGNGHMVSAASVMGLTLPFYYAKMEDKARAAAVAEAELAGVELDPDEPLSMLFDVNKTGTLESVWAAAFDARNQGPNDWTTWVVSPKFDNLPEYWQSPRHCHTIMEATGKDKVKNIKSDMLDTIGELQKLYDGGCKKPGGTLFETVVHHVRRQCRAHLRFPSDMASHWSLTQDGGSAGGATATFCHRCNCQKHQLTCCFVRYKVQKDDTLESLARAQRVTVDLLTYVNDRSDAATKMFKPVQGPKGVISSDPICTNNAWTLEQSKGADQGWAPDIDVSALDPTKAILDQTAGRYLRIFIRWPCNRENPDAFLKYDHLHSPYCMEHAVQRITEFLLHFVHARAESMKRVDQLNQKWSDLHTNYRMNMNPKAADGGSKYYAPSCTGGKAKALIRTADAWLPIILTERDTAAVPEIWATWKSLVLTGRSFHPTEAEIEKFCSDAMFFFLRVVTTLDDAHFSYYMHTNSFHGPDFLVTLLSLEKWMQEGAEAQHLIADLIYRMSFKGGTPGQVYTKKNEDGTYNKTDGRQTDQKSQVFTLYLMQRCNRLLYYTFGPFWDPNIVMDARHKVHARRLELLASADAAVRDTAVSLADAKAAADAAALAATMASAAPAVPDARADESSGESDPRTSSSAPPEIREAARSTWAALAAAKLAAEAAVKLRKKAKLASDLSAAHLDRAKSQAGELPEIEIDDSIEEELVELDAMMESSATRGASANVSEGQAACMECGETANSELE
ncbi:hypothetical protein KFL_000290320 [Klebsormidium nitens]|uniref:LysM domain-containing protein n=1 Tax=Klebsormidium nitens TaxID=105231 RepID=A0A1Y1HNR4_KLENI|nr:hypothetical protein KFL_000290320 [Klebsormidium nitens]|eukprot:GAQ79382.1 hypothetical protein KFL_000290320 [Klebsormidium nitens]